MFTPQDILMYANRQAILDSTTPEEQVTYIEEQIADPFNSGDANYFKQLVKMVPNPDDLDELCAKFCTEIQNVYPGLTLDFSEYEKHLSKIFGAIYKFFVKNVRKMMYIFIREYIFNNKNRRGLTDCFNTSKIATYPKEQYGKKEFYILISKLPKVIDEIFTDGITLEEFISYVERGSDSPAFLGQVRDAMDGGWIIDNDVVSDMYRLFRKSDDYRGRLNKLEMDIHQFLILPYLEENGLLAVRLPTPVEIEEEEDIDDDGDEDSTDV